MSGSSAAGEDIVQHLSSNSNPSSSKLAKLEARMAGKAVSVPAPSPPHHPVVSSTFATTFRDQEELHESSSSSDDDNGEEFLIQKNTLKRPRSPDGDHGLALGHFEGSANEAAKVLDIGDARPSLDKDIGDARPSLDNSNRKKQGRGRGRAGTGRGRGSKTVDQTRPASTSSVIVANGQHDKLTSMESRSSVLLGNDDRTALQELADPAAAEERPGGLPRSGSSSRLNAQAPEFVPRAAAAPPPAQPVIHVFAAAPPPPPAAFFTAGPPPPPQPFEYYAAVGGGGSAGFGAAAEHEAEAEQAASPGEVPQAQQPARDGISDDVVHKITKQVEYYFSDINLATTEHLMRFITKDPEGYVPIPVVAGFKKIKALVQSNSMLASALRTSSKLVVSEDGKRVKREQTFTESDLEELQARIVVAENLPDDHCYQNLMKLFSAVGSVRTIRTCYPQTPNGTGPVTNRSAKLDMLFANKLHAFVEYDTIEDAEKAIMELNDERNWRSGLRVRLLNTCMTKGGKGKKGGHEADGHGEEDVSTSNQPNEKHPEETPQLSDALGEHMSEESTGDTGCLRGRGRGRGGRGRGRGHHHHNNNQYHHSSYQQHHHQNSYHHGNNRSGAHPVGTPPSSHPVKTEEQQQQQQTQPVAGANKQPPGPRMPDGTRGFTMGRGKPQTSTPSVSSSEP